MTVKVIPRSTLQAWVDALIRNRTVYGPRAKEERFAFGPLANAAELRLDHDVTTLPPKKYFLPQREVLHTFDRMKMQFESVVDAESFVLFGVHPYDMEAIAQLDKIFSRNNYDVHYMTRRKNATIVVCDVDQPSPDVFAGCMGTATCENGAGFDVLLTRVDQDRFLVDARTQKGEALADEIEEADEAGEDDLRRREAVWERNRRTLRKHELELDPAELPALLAERYDHPVWAEKAEQCYSCGSCNLVCPTCYCFDVTDELDWNLATGRRIRTWDGCMLTAFAAVAGGHNFRKNREARYRHRYFRKGKYTFDMIGDISCVGCGRCITACTANIANPVEVFNRLLEDA